MSAAEAQQDEVDYGDTEELVLSAAADQEAEAAAASEDPELEKMKQLMKTMEEDAAKLESMQSKAAEIYQKATDPSGAVVDKEEVDSRSIYVGNCDYGARPEEVQAHFASCGAINRVSIMCDRYGNPQGYAYVEFADADSVEVAKALNESLFRGRLIIVKEKRTNIPGMRARGRGRGRGAPPFGSPYRGRGAPRGRARGFGRGSHHRTAYFAPY